MRLQVALFFPLLLWSSLIAEQPFQAGRILQGEPILQEYRPRAIESDAEGRLYLLIMDDHSIAVFDQSLRLSHRLGSIGTGPGELRSPFDFSVTDSIYVADSGNNRVEVLTLEGRHLASARLQSPYAATGSSTDGIFVAIGDSDAKLIRLYSREGAYLRDIGQPQLIAAGNERLDAFVNRGKVAQAGGWEFFFWQTRAPRPEIRKYDYEGKLLLSFTPDGPGADRVQKSALTALEENLSSGRIAAPYTLYSLAIEPSSGNLWIARPRGGLLVYSPQGRKLREYGILDLAGKSLSARDLAFVGEGDLVILAPGTHGCFRIRMPQHMGGR